MISAIKDGISGRRARYAKRAGVAFGVALMVFAMATFALADDLKVDLDAVPTDTTITEGESTSATYHLTAQRDSGEPTTGQPTCNASSAAPVQVTINSSPALGLAISPNPFSLTGCGGGNGMTVSFTGSVPGTYSLTATTSGGSGAALDTTGASWTLVVEEAASEGDSTPPDITIIAPADGATYVLGQTVNASYSCTDLESAVTQCEGPVINGAAIDTSSVGAKSFTVNATSAGGSISLTHSYSVVYNWTGFYRPVDNLPTLNVAKAGSAIPVKFSLAGNQGLAIMAIGSPTSKVSSCSVAGDPDTIEETVTAGQSSLSYEALSDQYNYVWKTDKAWAGTCRTLTVKLIDDTIHQALFKFTK